METYKNDRTLKAYLDEISRYPLLSYEEEQELSKNILSNNNAEVSKQKLINSNLRLVVKIAKGYMCSDMSLMDLIQEGNLGLIKSTEKFDYKKSVKFSTYSSWWIRQSIARAIMNKQRTIRLPHRKEESLRRIQNFIDQFSQEYMRSPQVEEIAEGTGFNENEVVQLLDMSSCNVSLDSEVNFEKGTLMDFVQDSSYDPDTVLMDKCFKEDTVKFLNILPEREKNILMYRYSFVNGEKYTLKQISEFMGISPETVRQIEIRAIRKLKKQAGDIRSYLYAS